MSVEIKVPVLPESVVDATVAKWYGAVGDRVERDENLVDLETDKIMLEVPAPESGVIEKLLVEAGATVTAGQVLAVIQPGGAAAPKAAETPAAAAAPAGTPAPAAAAPTASASTGGEAGPAARRLAAESAIDVSVVAGSGKAGRVTKSDVQQHLAAGSATGRNERRVPMSRLRQRIAERLVQVQQEAAILTTFNEINMKPVMDLRKTYKDRFEKVFGIKLGFMSFFTKAVVEALKAFPAVNASIDGTDILYHDYYDVGVAIGSERGLVVPVVRDADLLSMAEIEKQIKEYALRAKEGRITLEELTGGTFTITNGGTYGSMMSTPIINPPQTGILGMHNIVERAVVINGEIVIRPMMYVALSYDHRVIDGAESVRFLVMVKEILEDPARMLLGV